MPDPTYDYNLSVEVIDPMSVVVTGDPQRVLVEVPVPQTLEVVDKGPKGDRGNSGTPGLPGAGASLPVRVTSDVGSTIEVESVDMEIIRSCKWIVTVSNPFTGKYRMSEVMAFHDGTTAQHLHYGMFGEPISYTLDVVSIGGRMILRVTNSEVSPLVVDAVRVGNLAT